MWLGEGKLGWGDGRLPSEDGSDVRTAKKIVKERESKSERPIFSIFPCSPLPSGTCQTPGLSIPWCCLLPRIDQECHVSVWILAYYRLQPLGSWVGWCRCPWTSLKCLMSHQPLNHCRLQFALTSLRCLMTYQPLNHCRLQSAFWLHWQVRCLKSWSSASESLQATVCLWTSLRCLISLSSASKSLAGYSLPLDLVEMSYILIISL